MYNNDILNQVIYSCKYMYNCNKMCVPGINNNNNIDVLLLFYFLCFKLIIDWKVEFINFHVF